MFMSLWTEYAQAGLAHEKCQVCVCVCLCCAVSKFIDASVRYDLLPLNWPGMIFILSWPNSPSPIYPKPLPPTLRCQQNGIDLRGIAPFKVAAVVR